MAGRSRWWAGLVIVVCAVLGLGCSPRPLTPDDDGGAGPDATAVTTPAMYGPRPLTPVHVDAVALAADDSGIYWTSPANELWVLPAGSRIPVRLAGDPGVTVSCDGPTPPLLSSPYAFWMGGDRATLHRTRKDGTTDDRLAAVVGGDDLTKDGSTLYWLESSRGYADGYADGSVIRSLPRDAAPGSSPTTTFLSFSAISSLAVVGGVAYWTPYPNATVYYSDVWSAPVEALAGSGQSGTKLPGLRSPYALTRIGGDVYFAYYQDLWTSGLARLTAGGGEASLAMLPTSEYEARLAVAGGWLLASTTPTPSCLAPWAWNLFATPLAGGTPKQIAKDMRTPAVAAPPGIVFVDSSRRLVALPADQVDRTISPVP